MWEFIEGLLVSPGLILGLVVGVILGFLISQLLLGVQDLKLIGVFVVIGMLVGSKLELNLTLKNRDRSEDT